MTTLVFVSTARCISHVSSYTLESMADAFREKGIPQRNAISFRPALSLLWRVARYKLFRNLFQRKGKAYVLPLMGLQEALLFPWSTFHEVIIYAFDCLPKDYDLWDEMICRHRIRTIAFSARMVAQHFQQRFPDRHIVWIPEGIDPTIYSPSRPLHERSIDVLEFGRRSARYHESIWPMTTKSGYVHLFEDTPGQLVFKSRGEFINGLANAKISICFPSSLTHPERFGTIETVTHRYFESMASGALLVGHAPDELVDLCGYSPVIQVDWSAPFNQILHILNNLSIYEPLRARNLAFVTQHCKWSDRISTLLDQLRHIGYHRLSEPAGLGDDRFSKTS